MLKPSHRSAGEPCLGYEQLQTLAGESRYSNENTPEGFRVGYAMERVAERIISS